MERRGGRCVVPAWPARPAAGGMTGDGAERRAPGSVVSRPSEDAGRWTGGVAVGRCDRRREDAEALQNGGGMSAAGRRTTALRRGRIRRQRVSSPGIWHLVMYRPDSPRGSAWSPLSPSRGPLLVGPLSPLTAFEHHSEGGSIR